MSTKRHNPHRTCLRYHDGSFIDIFFLDYTQGCSDLGNTYNLACMMGHEDIVDAYWADELPSVAEAHDCSIDGGQLTIAYCSAYRLAQFCAFVSMTLGLRVKAKLDVSEATGVPMVRRKPRSYAAKLAEPLYTRRVWV